jgi:hypothetical protein
MSTNAALAAPLQGVLLRYRGAPGGVCERRPPGRPRKRTAKYLNDLLQAHDSARAWFVGVRGIEPKSDLELYTAFFANYLEMNGRRPSRTSTPNFQGKLKTLRNDLAEARRLQRANPENPTISGMHQRVKR